MSETLGDAMETAILTAAQQHGTIVTRYVLVAEVIEDDGKHGLWTCAPDDCPPWVTLGLLDYAHTLHRTAVTDDDDD